MSRSSKCVQKGDSMRRCALALPQMHSLNRRTDELNRSFHRKDAKRINKIETDNNPAIASHCKLAAAIIETRDELVSNRRTKIHARLSFHYTLGLFQSACMDTLQHSKGTTCGKTEAIARTYLECQS